MRQFNNLQFSLRRKLPIHYQAEIAECGMACLTMVASFHRLKIDLPAIRRYFDAGKRGTSMADLADVAGKLSLQARTIGTSAPTPNDVLSALRQVQKPAILHWAMNHWVVLKRVTLGNRIVIHDPAHGVRRLTKQRAHELWTGNVIELWPSAHFRRRNERAFRSWRDLIGHVHIAGFVWTMLSLTVVGNILALATPLFSQWAIDNVGAAGTLDLLRLLVTVLLICTVTSAVFEAFRSWTITSWSLRFSLQWRSQIFEHLLQLPLPWFQAHRVGDIDRRFASPDAMISTLNNNFVESVFDTLMGVVLLGVLFAYNLYLTGIAVAGLAIYCTYRLITRNLLRRVAQEQWIASAEQQSERLEALRSIRPIKLANGEGERAADWLAVASIETNAIGRAELYRNLFTLLSNIIGAVETAVIFWLAYRQVIDRTMTIGMVAAFSSYRTQFYNRISSFTDNMMDLKMVQVQGERLSEILLTEPEAEGGERVGELDGNIICTDVTFRYGSSGPIVLKNINLSVAVGENVAIVGPNGCGKSTLLHLITGLLKPTSGEICLGGHSIHTLGVRELRKRIGTVMQEETLLPWRVDECIAGSRLRIDHDRVVECAKIAAIHEDILAMPMGYATSVGDMGGTVSGGQKQRLCLARALYRQPLVLILDEASSFLHPNTETEVNRNISNLGCTRITVAHRFETIRWADRIIEIRGGEAVEVPKAEYLRRASTV